MIAGNWKMNLLTKPARALATAIRAAGETGSDIVLCPPFTALAAVAGALAGGAVGLAGQDCHPAVAGPHTGDIGAPMLRDAGCSHVLLGHSERRADHGETDDRVRQKAIAAQAAGLVPIVCVGETGDQRLSGRETEIVGWQLEGSLPKDFAGVIAYEPVWAIGTGRVPGAADIEAMHAFIREELARQFGAASAGWPILYGGSVRAANARGILATPHVGGALVGGASLDAAEFLAIARGG